MCNIPNLLSLSRIFFALGLLYPDPFFRACMVLCAGVSDFLDGFLARKLGQTSRLGTILDPITDKLFVGVALALFFFESKLTPFEIVLFLLRDISLLLFTCYLAATRGLSSWKVRSFFCGKMHTTCQFIALILLSLGYRLPAALLWAFAFFGMGSFFELMYLRFVNTSKL